MVSDGPESFRTDSCSISVVEFEKPKSRFRQLLYAITFGGWEPDTKKMYRVVVELPSGQRFVGEFRTARGAQDAMRGIAPGSSSAGVASSCLAFGLRPEEGPLSP